MMLVINGKNFYYIEKACDMALLLIYKGEEYRNPQRLRTNLLPFLLDKKSMIRRSQRAKESRPTSWDSRT